MTKLLPIEPDQALFLDFDGTLVDLAPRPDDVQVPNGLIVSLARLQERLSGALAIVSGRPISQIDRFLSPLQLPAAGLHGLEHRFEAGMAVVQDQPSPEIGALKQRLSQSGLLARGVFLEDKGATVALHYRAVPHLQAETMALMSQAVAALQGLHIVQGKMVVEAKPFSSDKGRVVQLFLDHPPFKGRRPVFIGDDVTDEDGIAAAQAAGGIGVKVGAGETCARYRLADVATVYDWLAGHASVMEN